MQIQFNPTKANELSEMLLIHSFDVYRGFTTKYRGFEVPNLNDEVKMKILHKLSPSNYLKIPPFEQFWAWFKKNHGMTLVTQMCDFLFPEDEQESKKMSNRVRSSKEHSFWKHIKARVYKKWCSIVTEAQCVYATVQGVESANKNWKVFASAELDAIGIDFVIVNDTEVVPVQVKKDSFSAYSKNKKNTDENLVRYSLTKKAGKVLEKEMVKNKINKPVGRGLLLKYGLMSAGGLPYEYLAQYNNGFVYFKSDKLVNTLDVCFSIENTLIDSVG